MRALLIAEKASLMKDIRDAYRAHKTEIPFDIDFVAQSGHLVCLKMPDELDDKYKKWRLENFPMDVSYQYKVIPGKANLVSDIRTAIKSGKYDFLIHAGDPDQEGELLVRLVLAFVGNTLPVKRFWSNDTTEVAVVAALKNLKEDSEYDRFYDAALTRQHADYQFGMNTTVVATLKMGELYKLGRVKAAIIRLLVDRERAIRNFVPTSSYKRMFTYEGCEFVNADEFDDKARCERSLPVFTHTTVTKAEDKRRIVKAPKLYKLSTLQADAARKLGFSAAQTLSVLQGIYEKHIVTYPRTDCEYLSSNVNYDQILRHTADMIDLDPKFIVRAGKDVRADKDYVNDAAIATEGHTAIIPTGNGDLSELSEIEEKLFFLIAKRFLALFAPYKLVHNVSATAIPGNDAVLGEYVFKATGDIEPGWELLLNPSFKMKRVDVSFGIGEILDPVKFGVKEIEAKCPSRYNDASILEAMDKPEAFKEDGKKIAYKIGTPATRAGILEECIKCGYFVRGTGKDKTFTATPKAERVIDEIGDVAMFDITNSGRWEAMLDAIRHGKVPARDVENALYKGCTDITNDIKARAIKKAAYEKGAGSQVSLGKCPHCGKDIVRGQFGAYCTGKCGMQVGRAMGLTLNDGQVKSLISGKKTMLRGLKSAKGTTYDAFVTPISIEPFSYKKASGEPVEAYGWKFKMEFPKRK